MTNGGNGGKNFWQVIKTFFKKPPTNAGPYNSTQISKPPTNFSASRNYQDDRLAHLDNKPNAPQENFNKHDAVVSTVAETYQKKDGSFTTYTKTETRSLTHSGETKDEVTTKIGYGLDIKKKYHRKRSKNKHYSTRS